jgi:hypothetical protein
MREPGRAQMSASASAIQLGACLESLAQDESDGGRYQWWLARHGASAGGSATR